MTPRPTALSRLRIASWMAARPSAPCEGSTARAVLTAERTWLRTARFRCRRFSLVLIRFRADRVLATLASCIARGSRPYLRAKPNHTGGSGECQGVYPRERRPPRGAGGGGERGGQHRARDPR